MFKHIVVALDESPSSGRALAHAVELARSLGADLRIVSVIEPASFYYSLATVHKPALQWAMEKRLRITDLQAEAREQASRESLSVTTEIVSGDEVASIVECAEKSHADLLVLELPKHGLLFGHTANDVAERAPCSLLGVR